MSENERQDRHTLPLFDPDIRLDADANDSQSGGDSESEFEPSPFNVRDVRQEKDLFSDI